MRVCTSEAVVGVCTSEAIVRVCTSKAIVGPCSCDRWSRLGLLLIAAAAVSGRSRWRSQLECRAPFSC